MQKQRAVTLVVKLDFNRKSSDHIERPSTTFTGVIRTHLFRELLPQKT